MALIFCAARWPDLVKVVTGVPWAWLHSLFTSLKFSLVQARGWYPIVPRLHIGVTTKIEKDGASEQADAVENATSGWTSSLLLCSHVLLRYM